MKIAPIAISVALSTITASASLWNYPRSLAEGIAPPAVVIRDTNFAADIDIAEHRASVIVPDANFRVYFSHRGAGIDVFAMRNIEWKSPYWHVLDELVFGESTGERFHLLEGRRPLTFETIEEMQRDSLIASAFDALNGWYVANWELLPYLP